MSVSLACSSRNASLDQEVSWFVVVQTLSWTRAMHLLRRAVWRWRPTDKLPAVQLVMDFIHIQVRDVVLYTINVSVTFSNYLISWWCRLDAVLQLSQSTEVFPEWMTDSLEHSGKLTERRRLSDISEPLIVSVTTHALLVLTSANLARLKVQGT